MIKLKFIVVDRTRSSFLKEGEAFYIDRLKRYARLQWTEVKPEKITKGKTGAEILQKEGESIMERIKPGDYLIALDRSGQQYDSIEFADFLRDLSLDIGGWVCFIVGGPVGVSRDIIDRVDRVLSLSRLTLTHEMCRLFLLEQLYRAFTIMEGHKYHR
jgi:23S rRNA (pseudouridine1915-N3)-methyltransferase